MTEQKIKQDHKGTIGKNIRKIRLSHKIGQVDLVRKVLLMGVPLTRESLVKIERVIQHIQLLLLRAIKDSLDWREHGAEHEINQVLNHKHLDPGSIILFHNDT